MDIKNPTAPSVCCYTTLWNIAVSKQALNDKLQGSVATYARRAEIFNIRFNYKFTRESSSDNFLKSVQIWQNCGHASRGLAFFGPAGA